MRPFKNFNLSRSKKWVFHLFILLFFCIASSFLTSCGTSVFNEAEKLVTLDNAETPAEYAALIEDFDATINSASSSAEDIQKASLNKAKALLGKNGITALDISKNVAGLSELDSEEAQSNIISLLNLEGVSLSEVDESALLLNNNKDDLSEDQQMTRGIANMFAAIDRVNDNFEVSDDGETVTTDENSNSFTKFSSLMEPSSQDSNANIVTFMTSATEAFTAAGVLEDEQKDVVDDFNSAIKNLNTLQQAVDSNTVYTDADGKPYDFANKDVNSELSQNLLNEALGSIFGGLSAD